MNKKLFIPFIGSVLIGGFILLNSCKKESVNTTKPYVTYSWYQEFDSIEAALQQGWVVRNNSRPLGSATWTSGNYYWDSKGGAPAGIGANSYSHSGSDYALVDYNSQGDPASGDPPGQASNWLISPATLFKNGDVISFWTRVEENPATYPDKLEFRVNLNNKSINVGEDATSVGDFTTLATTVNPAVSPDGFPATWTKYTYTITGLTAPKWGRFAFRYATPDAGPSGNNGNGIGIDDVHFDSN